MIIIKTRTAVLSTAASLMLAGCGGGDGGGGVGSTPTPSSPVIGSGTNTSLTGTLASEAFLNSASFAAISVPRSGAAATTWAGSASLSIIYNAATGTYSLNDGTRSVSVGAANIDRSKSNTAVTTYALAGGATSDSIILTNSGSSAGLTRYVGAGVWLRELDLATTIDGRVTSFTYGVQTGAGALPRSGLASFDVNLLGVRSSGAAIYALGGNGRLNVDFGTGAMFGSGLYSETNSTTGGVSDNHAWQSQALISSSKNSFLGLIQTDSAGNGEWHGAFYGPSAQEVGGSWSTDTGNGNAGSGVIWGALGTTSLNGAGSLTSPQSDVFFAPLSASLSANSAAAGGNLSSIAGGAGLAAIYRAKSGAQDVVYSRDGRITSPSSSGALTYQQFNTGLLYTRGGVEYDMRTGNLLFDAYAYGFDTQAGAVPRTGSATYGLVLRGAAAPVGQPLRDLFGNGALQVNFSGNTLTTQGSYSLAAPGADSYSIMRNPIDRGNWSGTAVISSTANTFSGTLAFDSDNTADFSASMTGRFFGPAVQEVAGSISGTAGDGSRLAAAFTGKQDSSIGAALNGLSSLTGVATLSGSSAYLDDNPALSAPWTDLDFNVGTIWDTSARSYRFKSGTSGTYALDKTFLDTDKVAAQSDATYTVYRNASGDARVLNPGAGNPLIALTYTSFAEITAATGTMQNPATWYVPFGAPTPDFQMPRSGSASYAGVVVGRGDGPGATNASNLSGTSTLAVNFTTSAATMNMALTATNRTTGAIQAIGTITYAGSIGNSCPSCSQNTLSGYPTTAGTSGTLTGMFYGANAAEFGGAFNLNLNNAAAGQASSFAGAVVARKAP
ncbi:beta strand repeat-containing protein [Novosphingobium sediminicola]|uniref:Transferrin-binding protein B C-lobe/N-lobe beta-barrel domain-containing protein n=1 Tax=Novosphingobium sediminicola TaxID=563162 RepID=A0A7W6CTS4_9SPHN|nr:transferrin-binding protein-like solute binding protein [Novosphingobium sediminicola]MBB3957712.1 hypothetical protein [Novosphingobium sediminicola]